MNKKTTLLTGILLILVMAFISLKFLYKNQQYRVRIGLSFNRTLEQLQDSSRLNKWFNYKSINGRKLRLKKLNKNPLLAAYHFSDGKKEQEFIWTASPENGNEYFTTLTLQYRTSYWDFLTGGNPLEQSAIENTNNLEMFTKNISEFYGHQITTTTVKDSTLLYGSVLVKKNKKNEEISRLFRQLMSYANKIGAGASGSAICHFETISSDSILIKASIGIFNPDKIPTNAPFQLKRMPYGKNLLIMDYKGLYGNIPNGYRILEQFRDDHNFKSMAIPYQEYPDINKVYTDSQLVTLKLYYPVF